jgi:hypothetical protein
MIIGMKQQHLVKLYKNTSFVPLVFYLKNYRARHGDSFIIPAMKECRDGRMEDGGKSKQNALRHYLINTNWAW